MLNTGTILEITDHKTYVFTTDCQMVPLKSKREYFVGQQIQFTQNDLYKNNLLSNSGVFRTLMSIAAVFVIVVSSILAIQLLSPSDVLDSRCTAVVSVDINPGIQIRVNKDGLILQTNYTNDDGRLLLADLSLEGKTLREGVDEIVSTAAEMGFITAEKKLVFVSAALNAADESDGDYTSQLKQILSSLEQGYENADVLTVFIEDPQIIEDAEANGLSIGKELLFKYARLQNLSLTAEDIQQATIVEILDSLNALEQNGQLGEAIIKQAESTTASSGSSAAASQAAPSSTASVASASSQKSSVTLSAATGSFAPQLSVTASGSALRFAWSPLSSGSVTCNGISYSGFKYYKVVASLTNPHPVYPDDGYLYVGSSIGTSSWSVEPSGGDYHQSPVLTPGKSYYFSITYVFDNGKFSSNTVQMTVPGQSASSAASSASTAATEYKLTYTAEGSVLNFAWMPLPASSVLFNGTQYTGFNYYKVVASLTNPNPVYPADGYLFVGSSLGTSAWSVDTAKSDYNPSPTLVAGKSYYFAITYVFGNGKFTSNTVQITIPAAAATSSAPAGQPLLTVIPSGTTLQFGWTPLTASSVTYNGTTYTNFQYYKVVASQTNPNPVYPADGYLYYNSTLSATGWSVDITKENYNLSPKLIAGKTYYFSITYVFGNGKFSSNTVSLALPVIS